MFAHNVWLGHKCAKFPRHHCGRRRANGWTGDGGEMRRRRHRAQRHCRCQLAKKLSQNVPRTHRHPSVNGVCVWVCIVLPHSTIRTSNFGFHSEIVHYFAYPQLYIAKQYHRRRLRCRGFINKFSHSCVCVVVACLASAAMVRVPSAACNHMFLDVLFSHFFLFVTIKYNMQIILIWIHTEKRKAEAVDGEVEFFSLFASSSSFSFCSKLSVWNCMRCRRTNNSNNKTGKMCDSTIKWTCETNTQSLSQLHIQRSWKHVTFCFAIWFESKWFVFGKRMRATRANSTTETEIERERGREEGKSLFYFIFSFCRRRCIHSERVTFASKFYAKLLAVCVARVRKPRWDETLHPWCSCGICRSGTGEIEEKLMPRIIRSIRSHTKIKIMFFSSPRLAFCRRHRGRKRKNLSRRIGVGGEERRMRRQVFCMWDTLRVTIIENAWKNSKEELAKIDSAQPSSDAYFRGKWFARVKMLNRVSIAYLAQY